MKRKVKDIISMDGPTKVVTIGRQDTLYEALYLMHQNNLGALPVIDNELLVGILSERDFTKASLMQKVSLFSPVQKIMTTNVYYVDPNYTLENCLQIMSKLHIRHLPVLNDGVLKALLSMRTIMEILVADRSQEVEHLMTYISGPTSIIHSEKQDKNFAPPGQMNTNHRMEAL